MRRMNFTPAMIITTIVSIAAFLGLAILGWGGIGPFFAHPARTALAVATVVFSIAALFSAGNLSPGEREDRSNRWVIAAFFVLGLASAYVPAYADRNDIWTIDGDAVRWIGVILFIVGGILRLWPVFVLGRRFSGLVAIQHDHALVTNGAYRIIRHPSYLGLIVGSLGWVLGFRSVIGVLLVALMLVPLVARMNSEERLLREQFGDEYDAYRARTARLVPGVY